MPFFIAKEILGVSPDYDCRAWRLVPGLLEKEINFYI